MGNISMAAAASHAPGLTGWFHKSSEQDQVTVTGAYGMIRDSINRANLDVLLIVGNDHVANNRVSAPYAFTVGGAERHLGPDDWFRPWLRVEPYSLQGAPELAEKLYEVLSSSELSLRLAKENLRYDDNVSVPVSLLGLEDLNVPIIPILQNCTIPPIPDETACYEFGKLLARAVSALPEGLRVGILGSGGMSHEPGGPRYLEIDEKFDRWFLDLLEEGDHGEILSKAGLDRMEEAGSGGTAELLSWLVVLGAVGERDCSVLGYTANEEWRCGIGAVEWMV